MKNANPTTGMIVVCAMLLSATCLHAQDWPQWRGPSRDAKVTGFKAPATWPKELTKQWKVAVGEGVATPALVGDKLYVFARQGGDEIIRCLDAATGKELWQDKYDAAAPTRPAAGFNNEFVGPRSSPTVADGKVVTLGVRGVISCYEAETGKKLWRNDDFQGSWPQFFTSSSPIVVDGLCIAQLGGQRAGAIVAYELASGSEKWKWAGDGTAYASPVLLSLDGAKVIVAETAANIVGIGVADGKLLWKTPFAVRYNACTPMVDNQTVVYSGMGRGTHAIKIEKDGEKIAAKELWSNKENSVQFNTPVVKDGLVFGVTEANKLFCISAENGKTAWTAPAPTAGGGGGRMGGGGYGSIVDAGSVLFGLTPAGKLIVFQPTDKEYKELASYKVAEKDTYAYPVIAGNRVFIKDKDNLTLWTIE